MAIPDFESLMRPLMDLLSDDKEHPMQETFDWLAKRFALTPEERERPLPNKSEGVFAQRVAWAKAWLNMAQLTEKGGQRITRKGQAALQTAPDPITRLWVRRQPGYRGPGGPLPPEDVEKPAPSRPHPDKLGPGRKGARRPVSLPLTGGRGAGVSRGRSGSSHPRFRFRAGCSKKKKSTLVKQARKQREMILRHNELQNALYRQLSKDHGLKNVGTECPGLFGTKVDLVVRQANEYWFHEIKIADSARACIREAVGQLLEYAFWPSGPSVSRLIVVGEPKIEADGAQYLRLLKKRFSLSITYQHFSP